MAFVFLAASGFSRGHLRSSFSILQDVMLVKSWDLNPEFPYNFPAWSVSVEWAMYLLFPVIMLAERLAGSLVLVGLMVAGLLVDE